MKSAFPNKTGLCLASMLCALVALGSQFAGATVITGTQNFQIVSRLTGPVGSNSINPTWQVGVQGTDLGHMVNHNGKTYFLFGDTFDSGGNQGSGGPDFRSNVMAWTTDTSPADGITFEGWVTRPNGTAKQVIFPGAEQGVPGFQPITYIPTGAISVGDKIYAWSMRVDWDGFPGVTGDDWMLSHAGLARWREGDSQFTNVNNFRFEAPDGGPYTWGNGRQGPGNFGMVAASYRSPLENVNDPHIYLWGTPGGREGGVKLARVMPGQIENLSAYQFFNGEVDGVPQWVNTEFAAQKIIPSRPEGGTGVGEMSVMYNEAMRAWTMTSIGGGIHIRYADNPWGPWSDPINIPVTTLPDRWGSYAPYMNPLYVENDGRSIYFTLSYWEPYDVFLAKVDLNLDFRTRWKGNIGTWAIGQNWSHGRPTAEHHVTLDNGGKIRLNTTESVRAFDVGTGEGLGGTIELSGAAALTVHAGGFRLGQAQGSNGTLTMTGGSVNILDTSRLFIVGDSGGATATISGGSITAQTFSIGQQSTATGHVALGGDAVINVTGNRFQMSRLRNSTTGERPTASLTMTGGTINVNSGASGVADFVPGWEGVATVDISGGTINVANNFVAAVAGVSFGAPPSQATITHSGGTINTGGMTLGERGISDYALSGTGQINARGLVRLGLFAGSQSTFTQNGGSVNVAIDNPALTFVGLKISESGQGTYTMNDGELNVPGRLWLADLPGSVGRMYLHGGTVNVGENFALAMQGNAELAQAGGNLNVSGSVNVAAGFANSVGLHNHMGGTLNVTDSLNVGRDNGNGTSRISGGNVTVGNLVRVWSTGTLNLSGGTLTAATIRSNEGGAFNFTGGTLHVGTFTGNLTNTAGTLAPGNSAGTTNVTGNYTQQTAATLAIEIGGLSAGALHDTVSITGNATLGGQLHLALTGAFVPSTSHTFTILSTGGAIFESFNNVASGGRLTTIDGTGSFLVHYGLASAFNPKQVILSGFELAAIPGDFNRDNVVDAADYVVWRRALANGTMDAGGYDQWKTNFGATVAGSGAASNTVPGTVPEPGSLLLFALGVVVALFRCPLKRA